MGSDRLKIGEGLNGDSVEWEEKYDQEGMQGPTKVGECIFKCPSLHNCVLYSSSV